MKSLLARGNSHRDVLEKYFDNPTVSHVALMESEAETRVVITSKTGEILAKSSDVDASMEKHLYTKTSDVNTNGSVVEDRWKISNSICTISPIQIGNEIKGYVYMFLGTDSIKQMIQYLTYQFIFVGAITFIHFIVIKHYIFLKKRHPKVPFSDLNHLITTKC
ncbi:hypothetical protein [Bacillus thuringiensis]|uniref:hypothetical protein n=1 Tax=Bacillus thuringiensis TaxID=1428 RepID=UPI000A668F7B|nr:hypothetical protein [Bacillus thuringiensis]